MRMNKRAEPNRTRIRIKASDEASQEAGRYFSLFRLGMRIFVGLKGWYSSVILVFLSDVGC